LANKFIKRLHDLYFTLIQVRVVLLTTCQWTQSATERYTTWSGGSRQVTTAILVVDRWLFSPTLDVRQTAANWLTG